MILGLTIPQFTALHVALSFIGIATGLIALPAYAAGRWMPRMMALFLVTTLATTLTGFLFPIGNFTPALGVGIISTVGLSMFPFILPSSIDPQSSLTVWNASSSHVTLFIMLICTLVFLPIVLAYTSWVYKVLWGRTSVAALKTNPDLY